MSHNQVENSIEETQQATIPNLQLQALLGEMKRMMRTELERQYQNTPFRQPPRRMQLGAQWGDVEDEEENDPEAYLEWEKKMEMVFEYHNYSENKRVKLAERRRNHERLVETWDEIKVIMRRRFIPSYYHRELYNNVDEYYKEMEIAMNRANVEKDREATMARFLHGLNHEITNVVEMQHYVELTDMVHQAIKVEQQLKWRNMARRGIGMTSSISWKTAPKRDKWPSIKPKPESSKDTKLATMPKQAIKCFKCQGRGHIDSQCPNKRIMVNNAQGEIEIKNEQEDEYAVEGESLVARRALSAKVCSVIINGGSCTNVAITELVEKLALPTLKHPQPYWLQWLNNSGEIKVKTTTFIPFCRNSRMYFLRRYHQAYHQFEKLNIKLTSYPVQQFQINQPIEVIPRRRRNFNGRFMN
ncbi:hypothetical protein Pfo_025701 [Paulownia fortunei]|nr:hypothetical protein Pfo_025701 [Paulownia fortunei]